MGEHLCCDNLGKRAIRNALARTYHFSLLLSPVVSFWDCIFRKIRYSFRPEWKVKCGQVSPVLKKGKKKQAKGELDRLKQAEKKKRRLEKALATSAAIRSELEKKKQKKIEEQQRLDAEGAAIAESVALHVLVGEDTDESCHFMVKDASEHSPWEYSHSIDHLMGYQGLAKYSGNGLGWATEAHVPAWKCNNWGIGLPLPSQFHLKDLRSSAYDEAGRGADISAGLEAAQAVASLQIAEDSHGARFDGQGAATVVINKLLGGSNTGDKFNIYRKI
ncbi:unnamed protein product [Musa acuminata subsp. burmannicoides]